jgi:hypothetical protein
MNLSKKKSLICVFQWIIIFISFYASGQTVITTNDTSCSLILTACEEDTIVISPQNISNYTNIKWYKDSIDINNEITNSSAEIFNVIKDDFLTFLPSIKVIAPGGKYIITADDANDGCSMRPDTINVIFSPKPSFMVNIPFSCPGTTTEISISNVMNVTSGMFKIDNQTYQSIPSPFVITGLTSGNHTVTIKDSVSGCENMQAFYLEKVKSKICMPISVRKL